MSKQVKIVETLVNKAIADLDKSKRVRVNARMNYGWGQKGELEEKYAVEYDATARTLTLTHWGTDTLTINLDTREVVDYYGESVSDRDSINQVLTMFAIKKYATYRPVNGGFEMNEVQA